MGVFTAQVITAVQNRINTQGVGGTTMGLNQALTYIEAIDVLGQVTSVSGGVVTTGGAGLTNQQYQELYEMLF